MQEKRKISTLPNVAQAKSVKALVRAVIQRGSGGRSTQSASPETFVFIV